MAYAEKTTVSEEKSKAEIETLVRSHGASRFMSGFDGDTAMVAFEIGGKRVRMLLSFPAEDDRRFQRDGRGCMRAPAQRKAAYEQERRQRWRALFITIKAKFAAVEAGITTLEREFFSDLLLPNNQTMAEYMGPQLDRIYEHGGLPAMLPGLPPAREES